MCSNDLPLFVFLLTDLYFFLVYKDISKYSIYIKIHTIYNNLLISKSLCLSHFLALLTFYMFVSTNRCWSFTFSCLIINQLSNHLYLFDFIVECIVKSVLHRLLFPVLFFLGFIKSREVLFFISQLLFISSLKSWINTFKHIFLLSLISRLNISSEFPQ